MPETMVTKPSCFMLTRGAMVEATYAAFRGWDLALSCVENARRVRRTNYVGGPSNGWLRNFGKVLTRRFSSEGSGEPLIVLAQHGCPLEVWKPLLLWHMSQGDPLVWDFFADWLYRKYTEGVRRLRSEAVHDYLCIYLNKNLDKGEQWTRASLEGAASGLFRMPTDFGILRGSRVKEFVSYRLPEQSFMYLAHAIMEKTQSPQKTVYSADWHLFMMGPHDVEAEFLRLHQYGQVVYQTAGTLIRLELPCRTAAEYAGRMTA